nr:L10-interacting MYB domain-containing protein-like [Lolium perenne]
MDKAEKAVWDDAHVLHFITTCKEEISNGNRPLGFLNPIGWKNLVEKFEARTGKKLTKTQLKNKWDSMKKEYTWFMELRIAATGLGWDDAKQTVDASKEWWDEHLQRCNDPAKSIKCNHLRYRKRGPKHLDDLHVMFEKAHVTGASASCPGDISSDECSDDDVTAVDTTDESVEIKLASLKKAKANKKRKQSTIESEEKASKKRKESSNANKDKDEKSPFFRTYARHM